MSKRGENIYKRKDNRWEGRYIKSYDSSGKAQFGYVYAQTYKAAREKLRNAKSENKKKSTQIKKNLSCFFDEWLTLCRSRVKDSTYVKYRTIINGHLKPAFGNCQPEEINTVLIEAFSHRMLCEQGLSAKTVRDILSVMRSVIKYIDRQSETELSSVEIIYPRIPQKEMRVLSQEEQNRLIQYLLEAMDEVKFGVLLALLTGMRIGELCALRWENILIREKVIKVEQTMQRLQNIEQKSEAKTKVILSEAKSLNSRRTIPLTEYAAALCKKMKASNPKAYILTGDPQKYMEPRSLQYRFANYVRACGIEDVHFHSLRHTFATRCVEVGFDIKSLSEILGHSNTAVTLERYVHSSLNLKRANMDKLSSVGM